MDNVVSILDSERTFTPMEFYTNFLKKLANYYGEGYSGAPVAFKLFNNGDNDVYSSEYRIDPIAIPLLLSIIEQLSKFHKLPLELLLNNNHATISVLEFLYRANFFKVVGHEDYYNFNSSKILKFNTDYLGAFKGKQIRKDHLIRAYKKEDYSNVDFSRDTIRSEIALRDIVNSLTSYNVQKHFEELLYENDATQKYHNTYIDILSELITNGVIHSESTTYAMMFLDKYRMKFSISDNGVGLRKSLEQKSDFPFYYKSNDFRASISYKKDKFDGYFIENLKDIFETLYYSSLKERKGLFDLMLNVVINSNGYFRLHTDNCQVIISNRIFKHIEFLNEIREDILKVHIEYEFGKLTKESYTNNMFKMRDYMRERFDALFTSVLDYYSEETRYSSIRFYGVKFKGVHIEVEIPND